LALESSDLWFFWGGVRGSTRIWIQDLCPCYACALPLSYNSSPENTSGHLVDSIPTSRMVPLGPIF
jgi:hypothetical protein